MHISMNQIFVNMSSLKYKQLNENCSDNSCFKTFMNVFICPHFYPPSLSLISNYSTDLGQRQIKHS